jgi:acetyl esterase/lipase
VVPTVSVHAYGTAPSQQGSLYLPAGSRPHPVAVLVHGGFWWAQWDRSLMVPLALDLVGRGHAVWNLEYRRVGEPGGGWPGTLTDVAAGIDHVAAIAPANGLHADRVAVIGHSAGGHLALWAAAEVSVRAVVALAPVADLRRAAELDLGPGAVTGLLGGGPDAEPERYDLASPIERLPLGVPQLLVHGERDRLVPIELSRSYAAAAEAAGDPVELVEQPGAGHFEPIDPAHPAWEAAAAWLAERLRG